MGFHYGTVLEPAGIMPNFFAYGNFAVIFFFVLSAFYLYQKAVRLTSARELISHRMIRLYPSYWSCILVTSVCLLLINGKLPLGGKEILINFTMLQHLFGIDSVDGAYWTLTYELILLATLAVLSIHIKQKKIIKDHFKYCVIWLVFCAMSRVICKTKGIGGLKIEALLWGSEYVYAFIIGISAYHIKTPDNRKWKILACFNLLYPILLYGICERTLCDIIAVSIAYLLLIGRFRNVRLKPLKFIGCISYEIYLLHGKIGYAIIQRAILDNHMNAWMSLLVLAGILIGIIILAYAVNQWSKKVIKLLTKIMSRFKIFQF